MSYQVIESIGLVLVAVGALIFLSMVLVEPDEPKLLLVITFSLLAIGGALFLTASDLRKSFIKDECEQSGGVFLKNEQTCLTAELFKGRLP